MATAMERATRRLRKQRQSVALSRVMGVLSGAAAPGAYIAFGGAAGLAAAGFLGLAALFLLLTARQA